MPALFCRCKSCGNPRNRSLQFVFHAMCRKAVEPHGGDMQAAAQKVLS